MNDIDLRGFHDCVGRHTVPADSHRRCALSHGWLGCVVRDNKLKTLKEHRDAPHREWLPIDKNGIDLLAIGDAQIAWWSAADASLTLCGVAQLIGIKIQVIAIAVGRAHVLIVDESGCVRVRGANDVAQCGLSPTTSGTVHEWTVLEFVCASPVIACGANHSLIVERDSGALWTCGFNLHGECGSGSLDTASPLQLVDAMSNVCAVAAGKMHSAVLNRDGELFAFGLEPFGGALPTLVASFVRAVTCGARHLVFVTNGGVAMGLGDNRFGQLVAADGAPTTIDSPIELPTPAPVDAVVAFDYATCFTYVATT